jgi:hypothetical protein
MTYLKRILDDTQREKEYLVDDVRDRVENSLRDYYNLSHSLFD